MYSRYTWRCVTGLPRYSRDIAEIQPRYSRDTAEIHLALRDRLADDDGRVESLLVEGEGSRLCSSDEDE